MATAAAGRGGESPPRNGGGSSESANGNLPAGLLNLEDSISDLDLTGPPVQVNRFLSAKNSVELHKSRGRRFFPNQSLPSVLDSEDAHAGQGGSGASTMNRDLEEYGQEAELDMEREGSQSNSGRSVNWADLRHAPAREALREDKSLGRVVSTVQLSDTSNDQPLQHQQVSSSLHQIQEDTTVCAVTAKDVGSHTSLYIGSPCPVETETESVSVLHAPTKSRPYLTGQSSMVVDIESFKRNRKKRPRESEEVHDMGSQTVTCRGGTPETSASREVIDGSVKTQALEGLINKEDGLNSGVAVCSADENPTAIFSPNANPDDLKIDYCGLPVNQLTHQVNDPLVYYHEESQIPPLLNEPIESHLPEPVTETNPAEDTPPPLEYKYLSVDDEDIDLDAKPDVKLVSRDDVPVPDHSFVARTVSVTLHPLIVRNCKKDCRSWLWKSAKQREVALRLQAENDLNGVPDSTLSSDDRAQLYY